MKKIPLLFSRVFLLVFSCLCFSSTTLRAEDPPLKIQALPDQNSVKGGMMFLVRVQVSNASADTEADFWSNSCSYEKHWVTDNAGVFIQSWTCNENILEPVALSPGNIYEKNIILYIPKNDKTEPVVFRLGFKRMSENGDIAEPLWSDPVTMNVTVSDEMKETTPSPAATATAQVSGQAPATSAEMKKTPPGAGVDPAAPAGSRPLVFRDPNVPVRVRSGEEFSILLISNPSTGFEWNMTLPKDQKIVQFLGSSYVAARVVMPGAPGEEIYQFKAATPGETKADFVYARSWETQAAPTRKIFTILVEKH